MRRAEFLALSIGLVLGLVLGSVVTVTAGLYARDLLTNTERATGYAFGVYDMLSAAIVVLDGLKAPQWLRERFDCLDQRIRRPDFGKWLRAVYTKHQASNVAAAAVILDEACR